ncbi:MAG: hypothetical protein WKG00_32660 [Polyangiaceae bacterium]
MRPDLRDYFAAQFASALAREQRYSLEFISGRAYELADAMVAERERRAEAELLVARDLDRTEASWGSLGVDRDQWDVPGETTWEGHGELAGALLDAPMIPEDADSAVEAQLDSQRWEQLSDRQPSLDPRWLEPVYDPSWDADRFAVRPGEAAGAERPGLSRTRGPAAAPGEQRSDDAKKRIA